MKNILLVSALCCSSVVFAGEQLKVSGDRVYDNDGHEYINEGSFNFFNAKTGKIEKRDCIPLAEKMDPNATLDSYPVGTISRAECTIKRVYDGKVWEGQDEPKQLLPLQPIQPIQPEDTKDLSSLACYTFAGYAPPSVWAPYIQVYSHIGPSYFTVKYKWFGDTMVNSVVKYYSTAGWKETIYFQQYSFTTGNAAASIYVSYVGIPLGSSVEGQIC